MSDPEGASNQDLELLNQTLAEFDIMLEIATLVKINYRRVDNERIERVAKLAYDLRLAHFEALYPQMRAKYNSITSFGLANHIQ